MSRRKIENGTGSNRIHDEYEASYIEKNQDTSLRRNGSASDVQMKAKKKKALLEFRGLLEDAITGNYLLGNPNKNISATEAANEKQLLKNIKLWGVSLLPTKGHQGTDVVLLKFLKAKDYKVHEAFSMLRRTLKWRRQYKPDSIPEQDEDPDVEKVMYVNGKDREGHPIYYYVYGALNDKELCEKIFEAEDNCEKFIRLKVQCMEKGIRELSFKPGEAHSLVQITDLKNTPPPGMEDLISKKALMLLQENYPGLIHRNIIINVPFWYYLCYMMNSTFLCQKAKNKFVFARQSKVAKTLLKFISPENLPVEYGGLNRKDDDEFFSEDKASELIIKKNTAGCIQIPVSEVGVTMMWDWTVVGWAVSYKEEFIPDDECSYRVMLQDEKHKEKIRGKGESTRNSFYINEPGKIVITIDNATLKKKRVFYRFKAKPTIPMYLYFNK